MRQMQAGGGKAMSFEKAGHDFFPIRAPRVTFEDVAGIDEAKEELGEIVEFLSDPKKFTRLGGAHPQRGSAHGTSGNRQDPSGPGHCRRSRCALFPPSADRISLRCSWASGRRVSAICSFRARRTPRALFSSMKSTPVGRHRGAGLGGGHDEREQTLNQLLVEMGRFRVQRRGHPHLGHQPPRRSRSGPAAPGSLRPPGGGPPARYQGKGKNSAGSPEKIPHCRRRGFAHPGQRDAWLFRRGP